MLRMLIAFFMIIHVPLALADLETVDAPENIEILSWDEETRAYAVSALSEPSVGPLEVSPEELARVTKQVKLEEILKNPQSIVDGQFTIEKTMRLLTQKQLEARRKKFKK